MRPLWRIREREAALGARLRRERPREGGSKQERTDVGCVLSQPMLAVSAR